MKKKKIVYIFISIIILLSLGVLIYLNQSYKPLEDNEIFYNKDNIIESKNYYLFEHSKKNNTAIIFYPGGKVEELSYAPLCEILSLKGYSVFLTKMPFNLAVFDNNRAESIILNHNDEYENWYLLGHSLGGAMAADYIYNSDIDNIKGLILLASYPSEKLDLSNKNIEVLSITATRDFIIDQNKFIKTKNNLPKDTIYRSIEDGNHAGFGNYGPQKRDGESIISKEHQWEITVNYIVDFLKRNKGE